MTMLKTLACENAKFCRREDGATSLLALYIVLISAVVGGVAIDFNKLIADRTRLQITADSVAHAALTVRQSASAADARTKALEIVDTMLPASGYGQALTGADIVFGTWNPNTSTFLSDENSKNAVRVLARQTKSRSNEIHNILLGAIGTNSFDAIRSSVFVAETDPCYLEGAIAEGAVEIRDDVDPVENHRDDSSDDDSDDSSDNSSDNSSDDDSDSNSDNSSDNNSDNSSDNNSDDSSDNSSDDDSDDSSDNSSDNSSDDDSDDSSDNSSYTSGDCIKSLTYVKLEHDDQIPTILTELSDVMGEDLPDYVHVLVPNEVSADAVEPEDLDRSAVNVMSCGDGGELELKTGTYEDMVIVSDCRIRFDNAVVLENTIVATTDSSSNSMIAAADLQIGRDDQCYAGGGSVLITQGDFDATARLSMYGGQIIAQGNINFAAAVQGFAGASLVAGGDIRGSGLIDMNYCDGEGTESNISVVVPKLRG